MKPRRVGVVGAGQLGRMLALAGRPLGVECKFLDQDPHAPAAAVGELLLGSRDDAECLRRLAADVEAITFEIENVRSDVLAALDLAVPFYPPPAALAVAQDRLAEKRLFESLGIPTTRFVPIDEPADLARIEDTLGWPVVLKARRLGYDGRGQRTVHSRAELRPAWEDLGAVPAIAESRVDFERELSLICVSGANGERVFYPLAENRHTDGILSLTLAPHHNAVLEQRARRWLADISDRFGYRGALTVEFFATRDGLIANEMAPRVHNSGHWTIEGAETSQFENHLRAVLGLPLGDTTPRGHAAMVNLLGRIPPAEDLLRLRGVHLHDYGKEPRERRKLGHCTIIDSDRRRLLERLEELCAAVRRAR